MSMDWNILFIKIVALPKLIYKYNLIPLKMWAALLQIRTTWFKNLHGNSGDPEQPRQSWNRRIKLKDLYFPIFKYHSYQASAQGLGKFSGRVLAEHKWDPDSVPELWKNN